MVDEGASFISQCQSLNDDFRYRLGVYDGPDRSVAVVDYVCYNSTNHVVCVCSSLTNLLGRLATVNHGDIGGADFILESSDH